MPSFLQTWSLPIAVLAIANIAGTWFKLVDSNVPDPYLDEVFHVPQAQRYCKGDYTWDPKITTPPGLYLISLLFKPIIGGCSTSSLRAINAGAICLICVLAYRIRQDLFAPRSNPKSSKQNARIADQAVMINAHTALNISLFPPLFFFSGLYYTDIISTLVVLLSYHAVQQRGKTGWSIWAGFAHILTSIVALSMRQTNIFWVAVFSAGLAIVDALKHDHSTVNKSVETSAAHILKLSWAEGRIHDCAVQNAALQDCVLFVLSTALAAVRKPMLILRVITYDLAVLGLFVGFVAWNGGVVLGDKSNHVATIHLPQMLYIWPYIIFFSFPLALPLLIGPVVRHSRDGRLKAFCQAYLTGSSTLLYPSAISAVLFLALGLATVHYNTIIHPFTLADNRHYVFYVFRILRRHYSIKYMVVPAYYICAWLTIQTLGLAATNRAIQKDKAEGTEKTRLGPVRQPCQLSFVMIWLVTTALSIISAPLVEPRYFIIPWIIWRLYVPSVAASPSSSQYPRRNSYDMRLVLETVWLLAIDFATGYAFLHRTFAWPSEPAHVQRFLW